MRIANFYDNNILNFTVEQTR